VFDSRIEVFRVLAHDDHVQIAEGRDQSGQVSDGPQIGVKVQRFAQPHVDAGEARADWGGQRAFQRDAVSLDRFENGFWQRVAVARKRLGPGDEAFPLDFDPRSLDDADDGAGDLGADAVAGNECYFVRHRNFLDCANSAPN
jgi:hypothetical protein